MKTKALARKSDPETSHEAAESIEDVTRSEGIVEDAVRSTGQNGATWDEVHDITGMRLSTISPRFKRLIEKGRIYYRHDAEGNPVRRAGNSGRKQLVHFHISTRAW